MVLAQGVLPDEVVRDHRAEALLVFADLDPNLNRDGVIAWLSRVTELVDELTAAVRGERVASVAMGFGPTFFFAGGTPRFGLDGRTPVHLAAPPVVANAADSISAATDVVFYVMTTSEAAAARFIEGLSGTRQLGLLRTRVERGFQREDGRELSGFLDGARNVPSRERHGVVYVNREDFAFDEPGWTEDGTYMAYLKVSQNLEPFNQLSKEQQEQIMGRRKDDGSRLDLATGGDPRGEGEFAAPDTPSPASHVRKTGPRGPLHDQVQIFRRGVPYLNLREDGSLDGGLHFVSFQWSLDLFDVMLNRWEMNPNFPTTGAGPDRLFAGGFANIQKAGFFFVPPHNGRFIGATMFDEPRPAGRPRGPGKIMVRKRVIDASGNPIPAELGGIELGVFHADTGEQVGDAFFTDSAGHAWSGELPLQTRLVLREVTFPGHLQPVLGALEFTLSRRREVFRLDNSVVGTSGPGY